MLLRISSALLLLLAGQAEDGGARAEDGPGSPSGRPPAAPSARLQAADSVATIRDISRLDTAGWLVHLARHQGHLLGRKDPRRASLHVLALLGAATEASPDCAEAFSWLYDLEQRLGRADAARAALSQYVRLRPGDEAAQQRHLALALADRQTAEARVAYINTALTQAPLPRAYESELRRRLAKYHFERRETANAAREVERALRLNPMNVAARQLAYEMFGETEPALQRVEMALQLISMNPSQANLIWDLAEFLDRLSLHRRAQEWYGHAIAIHRRSASGPVPAEFRHKLALSYTSSGDYAEAKKAADETLKVDDTFHAARMLRANAETKLGLAEAAKEDMDAVSQAYGSRVGEVVEKKLTEEAAQIAWFFCYHQPQADRALTLAEIAMEASNPGSLARLSYAYALRLSGRTDDALPLLKSLAPGDQLAALALAKIQIERGDRAQALTTLHKAATIRYSGIAYDMIAGLLAKYGERAAVPPLHSKVTAALDKFQRDVFEFHTRPEDFLSFTLRFAQEPLPPVGPVRVVFRLENVGPFAIALGEGFMCRPLVAVSARLAGLQGGQPQADATYQNYLQVLMNSRLVLPPGDFIEETMAIDVGPIRERLIRTVTQTLDVEVTAMFDPVYVDGALTAGLGTIKAGPIKAVRRGIDVSLAAVTALLNQANSPEAAERMAAAESLGALLADVEHRPPDSKASPLPNDAINTALATLLSDHNWQVRARAMVAVGWSTLDARVTNVAASGVRDRNAVVKLLTVRLFARQHGEKFVQVLEQLSQTDPSRLVRIMAESYLPPPPGARANHTISRAPEP